MGDATQPDAPAGITADAAGNIFVANTLSNTITEYAPNASGNSAPFAVISGVATLLDLPHAIVLVTPIATTLPATNITSSAATLKGTIQPTEPHSLSL